MKLAVTFEKGRVFPHFGRTAQFKVYTVENGKILTASVLDAGGVGHEALAGLLKENGIDVLLCGGMGQGAKAALDEAGILAVSGAEGDADEAVEMYLAGELKSAGVNCDHHEEKEEQAEEPEEKEEEAEEGCGGNCGSCGGGCGGCGGGCHQPLFEGPNAGKTVKVHYKGTFNDGTVFDSSYDRGEPLEFTCAAGMMIPGFDKAVVDMSVGEVKNIHLEAKDAYGEADPDAIFSVEIAKLPGAETLKVGDKAMLQNIYGQPFKVRVTALTDTEITFDANHEMAGRELNFTIEMVEISE